ncbi:MAG: DUF6851 domain-containing protein, partial [Bacteroidota bacterium]
VYDDTARPFFLGRTLGDYSCDFTEVAPTNDAAAARAEAISYAMYRLLKHRFQNSPGAIESLALIESHFSDLGYDSDYLGTDYAAGPPAALGNYVAEQLIAFGLQDGSNEINDYANQYYYPSNWSMAPEIPGNTRMRDPNRWQPLSFDIFVDQSGNPIPGQSLEFLSPEWGIVTPFALDSEDLTIYNRNGFDYWVYHDPGTPPYLDIENGGTMSEEYQWGFSLVSLWSAHLDPTDGVMWDISPGSIGNTGLSKLPTTIEGLRDFYAELEGGDPGTGHAVNPSTGQAYAPQMVPRGDYTRVLAEFWADGPDSETPPGHWFSIMNYVSDHPLFERKFKGSGDALDALEWDVKAYFVMGGAMHDAAVTSWGIKGWYDYLRPISAIRYMAELGQCSDENDIRYNIGGLPLKEDLIELVRDNDPLAGAFKEHVGKIKLKAWKGPDYIENPETDEAGVGWILAENWWPYQRPSFVTPPFAGYISGHSTFSRAAAEVMTLLTGDAYFPGGLGEFEVKKNEFLVFEEGPSVDFTLQWATYRDASDQTSLSRIWGGIHPPADDIPGRLIGIDIGHDAFALAEEFFTDNLSSTETIENATQSLNLGYLVAAGSNTTITLPGAVAFDESRIYQMDGRLLQQQQRTEAVVQGQLRLNSDSWPRGMYILKLMDEGRMVGSYRIAVQ